MPEPGLKTKRHGGVTYYIDPVTKRRLDQMALDGDTTVTALIKKAVTLLFAEEERELEREKRFIEP